MTVVGFEGNVKFRDGTLEGLVDVKAGDPVEGFAIREGRDAIVAKYREAGYGEVLVTYDQQRLAESGELVFQIEEGLRVRITEITFEGNTALSDRELEKRIGTRTALWIFRSGSFDVDQVESDVVKIESYYRDHGFLDARASFRRELSRDGRFLTIVFEVVEGEAYRIEEIRFHGNSAYSVEELTGMMLSQVGQVAKPPQLLADVRRMRDRYGEQGYIYATLRAIRVFSDTPGFVIITLDIQEGEQFRVGRVVVRGNTRTKDKVVRRALNLYPPDDLFNLTDAREAERRLVETRIFSSARVYPVGDAAGVRDIVIDVVESEKLGDFLFGVGVTSNSGLVGSVVLDLRNFDIFDRPRSWSQFLKARAFTGAGQHMRIELQPGRELNRFRVDFTEPYLFDMPLRLHLGAHLFERGRDGYSERRAGGTVSFGRRFERSPLRGWSGEVALRAEDVTIDNLDLFTAREVRDDEGSNLLTSVKGTLVRDRTDNRLVPTTGDRLQISYAQFGIFGGDHFFGRLTAGYSWFKTLWTDPLERKSVLHLRAEGGALVGDAPVFERFFAGGTGSLRGFAFRGVGEHRGIDDTNTGGDFRLLLGGEYIFPLIGDSVRGLLFMDTGMVGSGPFRASMGAGVRLTIQVFGPVPLEFSLAIPVSSDSDDNTQVFSFVVGRLF